jgi:hypothetical protein
MTVAPSIYATEPYNTCSDKYVYIPTAYILEGLMKEGFLPFFVAQSRCRIEGKEEYTKHMIRMRQCNDIATNNPRSHEIILVNSHDKTSSYQMISGLIEHICLNNQVTGEIIEDIRVRHSGNQDKIRDDVIYAAYSIVKDTEKVDEVVDELLNTRLSFDERTLLSEAAMELKYDEDQHRPITPTDLLKIRRSADLEDHTNAYRTMNIIQENLIKGGLHGRTANNQRTSTRAVNGIDQNIKLNRALWILTQKFAELKNGK